jgi:predicted 2-oxoglutarate/Fe(II)-dependent dioxygenase YbiX/peroxiredoxin
MLLGRFCLDPQHLEPYRCMEKQRRTATPGGQEDNTMDDAAPGLGRGERAPDFVLPGPDGTPLRFYARAGGTPTVLVFCDASATAGLRSFAAALRQAAGADLNILAVTRAGATPQESKGGGVPFPVFTADPAGQVEAAYRLGGTAPVCCVLDPNLRVLGTIPLHSAATTAQRVVSLVHEATPPIAPRDIVIQAPVLLIPNVLDRTICDVLIQIWKRQGHDETGVEESQTGRRITIVNHRAKSRSDHTVTDPKLLRLLSTTIGRRVLPEVRKAFAYVATRFEGFKIACYDAEAGGFFSPHRDNLSPATAHRRFALTLNLNDGYEGGSLRFAEYCPHLYRPRPGEAIIFSGAMLHEVTPVTSGQRFTLLSFLYGEEGTRGSACKVGS